MKEFFTRNISAIIEKDLAKKMVLLSGPRQCGKTSLAKNILGNKQERYLNWDYAEDREKIINAQLPAGNGLIVLDEIHKFRDWRNTVKGFYDKLSPEISFLLTGSARLEYYSFGGDSLQGRYFLHHLYPFTVKELDIKSKNDFNQLLNLSGFPEPFFSGSETEKKRWSRNYRSLLVREDIRDLEQVTHLGKIEQLAMKLPELVASPLSVNSLRNSLSVAHATVANWCDILERLFYIFRIYPFAANRTNSLRKKPKHYHYDWSLVAEDGARLENLLAMHLLKWVKYRQDVFGEELELRYYRDNEGREVDFILAKDNQAIQAIECKVSAKKIDSNLKYFKKKFPEAEAIQVELNRDEAYQTPEGIKVRPFIDFLRGLI